MVGGGLLQLVAFGAQDVYLGGNLFRIYYKQISIIVSLV
jgi:hypothetical protein